MKEPKPFGVLARLKSGEKEGARAAHPTPAKKLTAGIPLAKVIKRRLVESPEIVMVSKRNSAGAEKFRRLKTMLVGAGRELQVLVVTSPTPGDGKSFVAINLALAFAAEQRGRVLLLDGDLRRPTIDGWLTPPPKLGLSELLRGDTELDHVVLTLENSDLAVLPAGTRTTDSGELLSSARAGELIAKLRTQYDRIIIDTPPIVPFTDADAIGAQSDGALMVARSGQTRRSNYAQALRLITSTKVVGTVLNDHVQRSGTSEERHYEEYYRRERKR